MCSSYLCKKNCVFGHCLKLHVYFELCTSHHFVNVSFVASNWSEVEHGAMSTLLYICSFRYFEQNEQKSGMQVRLNSKYVKDIKSKYWVLII